MNIFEGEIKEILFQSYNSDRIRKLYIKILNGLKEILRANKKY